jgi:hypothetical protein
MRSTIAVAALVVEARRVRVGDYLDTGEPAPFDTVRVKAIRTSPCGKHVVIDTVCWTTWKHPREGVAVLRAGGDQA